MTLRTILTVMILAVLVLAGPVAMAFDGCAAMGAVCEGPCGGTTAYGITAIATATAPEVVDAVAPGVAQSLPEGIARMLDLPPRSTSLLS